jgi:hypothetical protein
MPSFRIAIEPNRRAAARFVGQVRRALQKAFVEEQQARGLTQAEIARELKVHRSVINRELKGFKDMTLGRVGELSWAMGRKASFSADELVQSVGANHPSPIIQPQPPQGPALPPPPATGTSGISHGMAGLAVAA